MIELKLNEPIEVNSKQYKFFKENFKGLIFHRESKGKYYIKVASFAGYKPHMEFILNKLKGEKE